MTVPIAEQLAEVEREVRDRERRYSHMIAAGRLKPETAERKLAELSAAAATLRFIAAHARALRTLVHQLRAMNAEADPAAAAVPLPADERAALLEMPGVAAVLEAWPEAQVLGIVPQPEAAGPDAKWAAEGPDRDQFPYDGETVSESVSDTVES